MNTVSIAGGATAAIFAGASVAAPVVAPSVAPVLAPVVAPAVNYAQTDAHPATQSDKPMSTPGATSGELKTPQPQQSSTPGMTGAAASDTGVPNPGRARGDQRLPGIGKPGGGANVH
ncbi:hypothetical protein [Paraburkholderia diazotrophica]|uniref:Uncharacterized protein n=1 Tax=Paraburkholderia diazotrophica TaxID=667676 RepID=A0A1H6S3M9_9BURK|nr:hypothetical protein [Paraburkholderia diazotrophica]SEI62541.1 hypothetical protein SAMN05192539_100353 [Paraburkholderia diazotrophica]